MINLGATYPIGIDIHSHNIYAAQLKKTKKGLAVRGLAHREVGNDAEKALEAGDGLVSQLKEIANNKGFWGKRVVVHLPSEYTHTFPLSIQVDQEDALEEAILRESVKHLSFPIEHASVDYPSIVSAPSGKAKNYKATVIAAHVDQIEQFALTLKQAGFIVEVVEADICSLMRLHRYLNLPSRHKTVSLFTATFLGVLKSF